MKRGNRSGKDPYHISGMSLQWNINTLTLKEKLEGKMFENSMNKNLSHCYLQMKK